MTKKIEAKKCCGYIEVKLKGEIYKRTYAVQDVKMVVNLINEMFSDEIHIEIASCNQVNLEDKGGEKNE